jgi:predicted alpha-1,6-mannanase (GH76 family)
MREALVDVLVDDVRLVEDQVALDQHRQPVVGIHYRDVLGLVVHVYIDDLKIHALLVQHDAASLRERTSGS